MGADDIFGTVITGDDVMTSVETTIRKWITTYLAEIERATGRPSQSLQPFRSYVGSVDTDRDVEDQLPTCVIAVPSVFEIPRRNGDGTYDAEWNVGVAAVVSAMDRDSTMALSKAYIAAIRMLLIQQRPPIVESVMWMDERYLDMADLGFQDARTIISGVVQFVMSVRGVVGSGGPNEVPADPYAPPGSWTTVQATGVGTVPG